MIKMAKFAMYQLFTKAAIVVSFLANPAGEVACAVITWVGCPIQMLKEEFLHEKVFPVVYDWSCHVPLSYRTPFSWSKRSKNH